MLLLFDLNGHEFMCYSRTGRYSVERREFDPNRWMKAEPEVQIRTAEDAQEYWAWVVTPTGMVFGIASRSGTPGEIWEYAADKEPRGGIDADPDWLHPATDGAPLEWS